jgi:hypothetical protein
MIERINNNRLWGESSWRFISLSLESTVDASVMANNGSGVHTQSGRAIKSRFVHKSVTRLSKMLHGARMAGLVKLQRGTRSAGQRRQWAVRVGADVSQRIRYLRRHELLFKRIL